MIHYLSIAFYMSMIVVIVSCYPKNVKHEASGEVRTRHIIAQEICTEDNGFKTDEQKRKCIMELLNCIPKGDKDEDEEVGSVGN